MKNIFLLPVYLILLIPQYIFGNTIRLKPDACEGKDAIVGSIVPNTNYGNSEDLDVYAWTQNGSLNINRICLSFNLSMIPENSVITSADLYLYYNPTNSGGWTHSGNNSFSIFRIVSAWEEDSLTWNNQPSIDISNLVNVPASINGTQNYIISVTNMVQNMIDDPLNSFGFTMILDDEQPFKVAMFASSDHPDSSLHPMIVINYTPPTYIGNCNLHLQPGAASGVDAIDGYLVPNTNYGNSEDLDVYAWTQSGNLNINRGYLAFDLSSIPTDASITNATLSLFYNPTNSGGWVDTGNNAFSIYRIIDPWTENGITWNNRPAVDSSVVVNVPASTSGTQNYTIDVTSLLQQMVLDPSHSFGFNMRLDNETPFNVVMFASSDHPDCNLHPILDVSYSFTTGIHDFKRGDIAFSVFPNPMNGISTVTFNISGISEITLLISDLSGHCVYKKSDTKGAQVKISKELFAPGMYLISLLNGKELLATKKLVVD